MEALLAAATLQHAVAQAAAAANSARLAADALGSAVAFAAAAECQLAAATLAFETLELPIESAEEIATAAAAKVAAPRKLPVWGASFPPPGLEDCRLRPAQLGSRAVAGDRSRHRAFGSDLALRTGWSAPYLVTNAGRDAGCMVHVSGLPPTWSQRFLQEWAVGALGLHGQTHLVRIQTNLELYEGKSQAMLTFRDRGFAEIAKSSLNGARILDGGFASASVYLASGYIVHVSGLPREQPQQALRDWADSVLDRVCADRPHGIQTDLGLWRGKRQVLLCFAQSAHAERAQNVLNGARAFETGAEAAFWVPPCYNAWKSDPRFAATAPRRGNRRPRQCSPAN